MNSSTILRAEWKFLKLFFPFLFYIAAYSGIRSVTTFFAGRIDNTHLDGVGLATTLYCVVMMAIEGFATVFDTYGAQVYGSTRKKELGTVALKCAAQGGIIYLFVLGPYLNLVYLIDVLPDNDAPGSEFVATDVEHSFKDIAVQYLRITCGCGYLNLLRRIVTNYMAIQGHTTVVYVISASNLAIHIFLNYVFVEIQQMGNTGLGLATLGSSTLSLALAMGICYVMIKRKVLAWSGFSMRVFENWVPMLKLGFSGIASQLAEISLFDGATFLSQLVGTTSLSTIIIQIAIFFLIWSVSSAIANSSTILIGKYLGEGDPTMVKLYMKIAVLNTLIKSVPLALLAYLLRSSLVAMFSSDKEVVEMFSDTFGLCCLMIPIDQMQVVLGKGILVAFGKQRFVALSMSVCCYGAGLPIIVLTILLTDLKLTGIYFGFFAFELLIFLTFIIRIYRLDIAQEIENTVVRVDESAIVEQNQVVLANPLSVFAEGISEVGRAVATTRTNKEENGATTRTKEEEDGATTRTKEEENGATTRTIEEENGAENTKHPTECPSLTKDAKWIISCFFGAVFSVLIFSTISFIK